MPSISAIICTRNRSRALAKALGAMTEMTISGTSFDLTVVDNGSTDDTKDIIACFMKVSPFRVSYQFEATRGLSRARNRGLKNACGDVLAFTDDDCYVHRNWAASLAEVFSDGTSRIIGGRIELFNKAHLPMTIKTDPDRQVMSSTKDIFGFMHGANMAFNRAVYEKVGEFDTRLGAGSPARAAEDIDYVYRAFNAGFTVCYEPAVVVDHDHGRATKEEGEMLTREYIKGKGALAAKHLMNGRSDIIKTIYWNARSEAHHGVSGAFGALWKNIPAFGGALRYLVGP